jgi:DNA gyrase subunit A
MLFASNGKAVRFEEADVRAMGRAARGVRGIRMAAEARMIALIVPAEGGRILTVSQNGYGKRTEAEEFPTKGRGTQGVIAMQCSERNGQLVAAVQVFENDELMLISDQGTLVRTRTDEVSVLSRNTQGVRIIRLKEGESLVGVERIAESENSNGEDETDAPSGDVTVH